MRARLLALAAFLSAAAVSTVAFLNWNTGERETLAGAFGAFEVVDRSFCTSAPCGAQACDQAHDVLADAGSSCTLRLVECPVRLGARARAQAADAGVAFSDAGYQQVRFVAMRCPVDGGFTVGVPVNDAGWPVYSVSAINSPCAWKPTAGADCSRVAEDGGLSDPGARNTMQAGRWVGAGCARTACVVVAGEEP